jgi:hypothetical protein
MAAASRKRLLSSLSLFPLLAAFSGCSGSGADLDPELSPLVGNWKALSLVMTSQVNADVSQDLIEAGATFSLSILATGQYSAVLSAYGQSNIEAGTVSVEGDRITLTPVSPPGPSVEGSWEFQGMILIVDGESEFDFNLDGISEAALVHFELEKTGS